MTDRVRDAFRDQARSCRTLGSPFTAALCEVLADGLDPAQGAAAQKVLGWPGNPSSKADSVPLRLCGGLHALVLTGQSPDLAACYAARDPDPTTVLTALSQHAPFLTDWLDQTPQTNEVARAGAIIPAARFAASLYPLPLDALELGASAGLNLNFGRFVLDPGGRGATDGGVTLTPDWQGDLPDQPIAVAQGQGVDLHPLDPVRDGLRLQAYCWADQPDRMARLRAALDLARQYPPQVSAGDAGEWLAAALQHPRTGRLTFVYHTIAAQYFPRATRDACEAALQRAAAAATSDAPLAHFGMEADGAGDGAGLQLRLWDGTLRAWTLGRADFHGRWVRWQPQETEPAGL